SYLFDGLVFLLAGLVDALLFLLADLFEGLLALPAGLIEGLLALLAHLFDVPARRLFPALRLAGLSFLGIQFGAHLFEDRLQLLHAAQGGPGRCLFTLPGVGEFLVQLVDAAFG